MPEYRIKNWGQDFENNRTRELKHMEWVPIPNRMDGEGYTALVDHPNAAAHFGAWIAIVEIASRREARGTLPIGIGGVPKTLSRISRLPVGVFEEVLPRLVEIGWIEEIVAPQEDAGLPQDNAPRARAQNGTEGNGREENGTEGKTAPAPIRQTSELGIEGWDELIEVATKAGMSLDPDPSSDLCQKVWRYRDWDNRRKCIQGILDRIACGQYSQDESQYVPSLRKYIEKNLWRETSRPRNRGQPAAAQRNVGMMRDLVG